MNKWGNLLTLFLAVSILSLWAEPRASSFPSGKLVKKKGSRSLQASRHVSSSLGSPIFMLPDPWLQQCQWVVLRIQQLLGALPNKLRLQSTKDYTDLPVSRVGVPGTVGTPLLILPFPTHFHTLSRLCRHLLNHSQLPGLCLKIYSNHKIIVDNMHWILITKICMRSD